jgi:hypothetical protein
MGLHAARCGMGMQSSFRTKSPRMRGVPYGPICSEILDGAGPSRDCYIPCVEPEGDPEGTGSPRGPPIGGRLWFDGETNRENRKAPRMAATIRDPKIQIKVNDPIVSHRVRGIKRSLTTISRKYVGNRADRLVGQALLPAFDARLSDNVMRGSSRAGNPPPKCPGESAPAGTSASGKGRRSTSRGPPSVAVAQSHAMLATIQICGAKVRPRMAATIRSQKEKLIWLRQQYWRPRLRYQVPPWHRAIYLNSSA